MKHVKLFENFAPIEEAYTTKNIKVLPYNAELLENLADGTKIKLASVSTRNYDWNAVYSVETKDEDIKAGFMQATRAWMTEDYDQEYWDGVKEELRITECNVNEWLMDGLPIQ